MTCLVSTVAVGLLLAAGAAAQPFVAPLVGLRDEAAVVEYIQQQLGDAAVLDATGSVFAQYGQGEPHTLLIAGLDEPGYIVSGITEDGYLRVQRLAEGLSNYQFDGYFPGQPVQVLGPQRLPLAGVVVAPSVHFRSDRSYGSRVGLEDLYVDIGANSPGEAAGLRASVLDRVHLMPDVQELGAGRTAAPWTSSRAGAAVLLSVARGLRGAPSVVNGRVTLAFVTQQHFHSAGLARALQREPVDRIVVLRPGGDADITLSSEGPGGSDFLREQLERAEELGLDFRRGSVPMPSFGPFETGDPWPAPTILATLGVRNAGTPASVSSDSNLGAVDRWLRALVGAGDIGEAISGVGPGRHDRVAEPLQLLTQAPGLSGAEGQVRNLIQELLPETFRQRAEIDDAGNLIVPVGGPGAPAAIFIAHMDEIGFKVTSSTRDGELSVEPQGGLTEELFAFHPMRLWVDGEMLPAVMERAGRALTVPTTKDLAGASLLPPKHFLRLGAHRVSARGLDDRAGCAALLAALKDLAENRPPQSDRPVWFVFSVEEEIGLVGAEALARRLAADGALPDRVYPVDSLVTSDSPLEPKRLGYLPLGAGPAVRAMDNSSLADRTEVERVLLIARQAGLTVQAGVTAGGNDGSKFIQFGVKNVPLAFPLRSSHTSAETADIRDLEALSSWIEAIARAEMAGR